MSITEIRRIVAGAAVIALIPAFVACGGEEETEEETETSEETDTSEETPAE